MQDIIKSVVDNYPTSNIFYSVLSFGDPPVVHINFDDQLSDENRKRAIDSITKTTGTASLDKALETARDLFNTASALRPTAKNIVVVMVDGKSDSKLDDVKASSRLLQADGVRVIVVGVGNEVDKPEIDVVTETTVLTNTTDNPDSVAEVIIITINKGKEYITSFFPHGFDLMLSSEFQSNGIRRAIFEQKLQLSVSIECQAVSLGLVLVLLRFEIGRVVNWEVIGLVLVYDTQLKTTPSYV